MSVKKLEPVQALPTDHPLPPRPLGKDGMATWMRIQTEYGVTDSGGIELLFQACAACDRVQSLSEQIAQDGEVIRTKHGVRAHPALRDELANRSFICRTLHRLGLDVEAVKPIGRPPKLYGPRDDD
jgi:hypothetical protein